MTVAVETPKYAPGTFFLAELPCRDAAAAKAFYCGVFGWELQEAAGMPGYIVFAKDGKPVCGAWQMAAESVMKGNSSFWLCCVFVEDVDAVVRRAEELGGERLGDIRDGVYGRSVEIVDPTDSLFVVFKQDSGAQIVADSIGMVCWNELVTSDPDRAAAFYGALFGWTTEPAKGMANYTVFSNPADTRESKDVGGMVQLPEAEKDKGSFWLVYFGVASCDEACAKAISLGGKILVPSTDIPAGRFAELQDPQGAPFGVIEMR